MSALDATLLAAIRDAHASGRLAIDVNFPAVNRSGAPGFRTTDIVVPWFVSVALSLYVGVAYGAVAGVALFVVLAGLIVAVLRPLNRTRAVERNRAMGLASVEHWEALWRMGGLALRDPTGRACAAPDGDWRGFARDLPAG